MKAPEAIKSAWGWITASLGRKIGTGAVLLALVVGVVLVATGGDDEPVLTGGPTSTTEAPSTSTSEAQTTVGGGTAPPSSVAPSTPEVPVGLQFIPEDQADNGTAAPLTGLPVADGATLNRAALAVKIDNLDTPGETARPQVGLAHADVVIEEIVEGGITRFVAVLHSTDAPEIGPIRSARTTDINLLGLFGRPLFAYSGGNPGVLSAVRDTPWIVDRGGEWAPAYVRVRGRRAPHNLFLRPWEVWNRGEGASLPPTLAPFRPRGTASPVGEPTRGIHLAFPGAAGADVTWTWSAEHGRWLRHQGGTLHLDGEGWAIGPRNVVVMFTDYVSSPADPRSPEGISIGSGDALVLTDGKLVQGRWSRPTVDSPLALLDGSGAPVALTPGRTWIELVRPGAASILG